MAQDFVTHNTDGGCQIERTHFRMHHRNGDAEIFELFMYIIGTTRAFIPEQNPILIPKRNIHVRTLRMRCQQPNALGAIWSVQKCLKVDIFANIQILPVIHAATFQIAVGQRKTERTNEMQACTSAGTQTPNVARVLRNFRAKKNNVDHLKYCRKHTELTPLPASRFPKPHTTYSIPNTLVRLDASDTNTRTQRKDALHHKSAKPAVSRFFERAQNRHKLFKTLPNGTLRIPLLCALFQILTLIVLLLRLANGNFQLRQTAPEVELHREDAFPSALQCTTQLIDFPFMEQQKTTSRRFVVLRRSEFVRINITVQPHGATVTI